MGRPGIKVGERHGSNVVIGRDPSGTYQHPRYMIRCDCGAERVVSGSTFRVSLSCRACSKVGQPRKYGDRVVYSLKIYHSWIAMRRRCDPTVEPERNARWAGRGITVCKEWNDSFEVFETWALANGYQPGLSIDRVNNDGNYEPGNCQWVTRSVNSKRARALYEMVQKREYEPGITQWL